MFTLHSCLHLPFRCFYENGNYHIGGFRQHNFHGKGEFELEDGDREVAFFVDNKREGKAKYYSKDGTEQDRLYKDDEIVKE